MHHRHPRPARLRAPHGLQRQLRLLPELGVEPRLRDRLLSGVALSHRPDAGQPQMVLLGAGHGCAVGVRVLHAAHAGRVRSAEFGVGGGGDVVVFVGAAM